MTVRPEELLASVIADLIGDVRHVAVGNASPIPATAALLARERGHGRPYVSLLGSPKNTSMRPCPAQSNSSRPPSVKKFCRRLPSSET